MKASLIIFCCLLLACQVEDLDSVESKVANLKSEKFVLNSNSNTINVSGEMIEQNFQFAVTANGLTVTGNNSWSGSLEGVGHVKILSSTIIDPYNGVDIVSKRFLYTPNGNLFFDEIGSHHDDVVYVVSTVTGGTGIFKKAQGSLILNGIYSVGLISFNYTGTITIPN